MQQYDFFYDGQIRRFILQIVRAFSGFQYEIITASGTELRSVPCRMATQNRQVAHLMKNNSENSINSIPLITVWMKEVAPNRERTQAPGFVSSVHATEREIVDGKYTGKPGNKITIERLMPHPIDITVQVDVWTSNEMQKHQLWEQIFMMFNTSFPIQSSDNPIDWTALTSMELQETVWTSKTIPSSGGSDETIDAATFVFKLPMWISPPAKLKKQKLIQQVITNVNYGITEKIENPDVDGYFDSYAIPEGSDFKFVETHQNAIIEIKDRFVFITNESGVPINWSEYVTKHGYSLSRMVIHLKTDIESSYKDDIQLIINPTDDPSIGELTLLIESVPDATIPPIVGIIDPLRIFQGSKLPSPTDGDRYLIINDVSPSVAWGSLKAKSQDVIEFNSGAWAVAFDSKASTEDQFLVNNSTNKLLRFTDGQWVVAIDGQYAPGLWRMRPSNI